MQFKFKFYTFQEQISSIVVPKEMGSLNRGNVVNEWQCGQQYKLELLNRNKNEISEDEGWIYKTAFKIDPSTSLIKDENLEFAQYLKNRIMTIEIFDADSLLHFGTVKVPLYKIL
jgi:hypothetical protein